MEGRGCSASFVFSSGASNLERAVGTGAFVGPRGNVELLDRLRGWLQQGGFKGSLSFAGMYNERRFGRGRLRCLVWASDSVSALEGMAKDSFAILVFRMRFRCLPLCRRPSNLSEGPQSVRSRTKVAAKQLSFYTNPRF